MKIAFLTRYDAFTKFGGDTHQISTYSEVWQRLGHTVDIITEPKIIDGYDYYIVVNIDRFLETFCYLNLLKKKGVLHKTLLLPIHHNFSHILNYEVNYRKDILGFLSSCFGYFGKEKIKSVVLAILGRKFFKSSLHQLFINHRKFLKEVEGEITFIILANGERLAIESDFNINIKNYILTKNGFTFLSSNKINVGMKEYDVLISGRIELRKNSLRLAQFFSDHPSFKVAFVGQINNRNKSFSDEFMKIVGSSNNISYLGKVEHSEMQELFYKSKVHVSASWFEVSSLVDLEAYAYGCSVISSKNGNTSELLGDRINYISPLFDFSELYSMLNLILSNYDGLSQSEINSRTEFMEAHHSWEKNSIKLLDDIVANVAAHE